MAEDNRYFFISGILSFIIFALFGALFFMMLLQPSKIKNYALHKNNFVSISLENIVTKSVAKKKSRIKKVHPLVKPVDIPSENIDVNNLFSDVWTKKISKKKPKPQDIKRLAQLSQQVPLSQKNEHLTKEKEDVPTSSNAQEVNEYFAKIQAIVYEHFNVPPNSQGNSVKVVIELSSIGKLIDFRILNYSANDALNEEARRIKKRLLHVVFPIHPENKSTKTIVILTSKE